MHRNAIYYFAERDVTEFNQPTEQEVWRFLYERIESVPHLEALLLLRNSRPKEWSVEELAKRLYVDQSVAAALLQNLSRQNLVASKAGSSEVYFYESRSEGDDQLIAAVQAKYKVEIVAVSNLIHRKVSSAVRDFAEAFRFIKERE